VAAKDTTYVFKILQHALEKLTAFSTHAYVECTPLVNGRVSDALLNAAVQDVSRRCCKILHCYMTLAAPRKIKISIKLNKSINEKIIPNLSS